MIVITLTKVPPALRGDLTKWCQEIQTGVYVGNVNARVRERLWERINKNIGQGEATLVYNTNNELGYTFRTTRRDKEIFDADGVPLIKTLFKNAEVRHHGFSDAYKYHQARIHQPKPQSDISFATIDLETTGLNPINNQIISIGAVKKERGKVSTFYRLIKLNDGNEIPSDIAKATKLNAQLLRDKGIELKEVILELKQFLNDLPVVGYNLLFDEGFLQAAINKYNIIQFSNRMIDILPYVKKVDKFCDNYRLATVLKKYKIKNAQPHNSLTDARATMELVDKLIKSYNFRINN